MRLAGKTFTAEDQARFASLSGDFNPMHVDEVLARRTQAGAPVVHGMHLVLWALDAFAASEKSLLPLKSLKVQFDKFVYVGEPVEADLDRQAAHAKLTVSAGGAPMVRIGFEFGEPLGNCSEPPGLLASPQQTGRVAQELSFEEMSGREGRLTFATAPGVGAESFPAAARWLGAHRLAALAACSALVGMVCPGLHSIFSALTLEACGFEAEGGLAYRVSQTDRRFRLVRIAVAGGGFTGNIATFVRQAPAQQPSTQSLKGSIGPAEFKDSVVLVVGGSRGLGELTSKLVASGGARVVLTYSMGRDDAERVAAEIRAGGGMCETLRYDARRPAEAQLAGLSAPPTHVYYFATPPIFRPSKGVFDSERFKEFADIYVEGFWRLSDAVRRRSPSVSIFYPSSEAVALRPKGMTEYAMAKAAGEALANDMNAALAPMRITVARLPRLPTDQTATITNVETASPVETILPVVREVQSWPRRT